MSKTIKKLLAGALAAALFLALALTGADAEESAYDFGSGLDAVMAEFMESRKLNSSNFGMGFYNTVTGETWYYNADSWMTSGSMAKVPLVMVYVDQIAEGTRSPDDSVGGYRLATAMYRAIVFSDNKATEALYGGLGRYGAARLRMAKYCGIAESELPQSYLYGYYMSPRYVIGTLRYLYENSERYGELIGWMKQAHAGRYFQKGEETYEIAHKYGAYEGWLNDCGIIYTPEPYLLVVFHYGHNEQLLADLRELATAYARYAETYNPLYEKTIDVSAGVRVYIDGEALELTDADGRPVQAFLCDGTTYLPARAITEALGGKIVWDGETHRVYIESPEGGN